MSKNIYIFKILRLKRKLKQVQNTKNGSILFSKSFKISLVKLLVKLLE
jgi:hypothetical protein